MPPAQTAKTTMTKRHSQSLRRFSFGTTHKSPARKQRRGSNRTLAIESLEPRQMLSVTPLQNMSFSANAGEKPQSKIFQYADQWWTVMPTKAGTFVYRLDGTSWTA